ncbi:helix-hairpin-helix domain-containing protein [Cryobacterium tepidiphilum]|uniref:Helix-hairpin-helix domain-containing protein n=1 Tax=Cryobacterium tepidiphilum TaxID=2486026 RepID=A0A3M8KZP3_9MICO|nr:helix-hairpin-helix domain-containing protein [Cryobacterium tepidiphilum]RNE58525.1 helix-hairpin-helix domain-containing protein [Cryobacterium tepidiphilum]
MDSRPPPDPLARLDARARPRVRLGIGAAVVLLIVALVTAVLVSAFASAPTAQVVAPTGPPAVVAATAPPASPVAGTIFVHVLGAVRRSGLFEVRAGARVMDVVAAAGGLTARADPAGINLARPVSDGEQVYVPSVGETRAPPAGASAAGGASGAGGAGAGGVHAPVNLNTATIAELETLPRIGPAMAQRIIDYRNANGPFASVDDLRSITGIGDKTLEALAGQVTV